MILSDVFSRLSVSVLLLPLFTDAAFLFFVKAIILNGIEIFYVSCPPSSRSNLNMQTNEVDRRNCRQQQQQVTTAIISIQTPSMGSSAEDDGHGLPNPGASVVTTTSSNVVKVSALWVQSPARPSIQHKGLWDSKPTQATSSPSTPWHIDTVRTALLMDSVLYGQSQEGEMEQEGLEGGPWHWSCFAFRPPLSLQSNFVLLMTVPPRGREVMCLSGSCGNEVCEDSKGRGKLFYSKFDCYCLCLLHY